MMLCWTVTKHAALHHRCAQHSSFSFFLSFCYSPQLFFLGFYCCSPAMAFLLMLSTLKTFSSLIIHPYVVKQSTGQLHPCRNTACAQPNAPKNVYIEPKLRSLLSHGTAPDHWRGRTSKRYCVETVEGLLLHQLFQLLLCTWGRGVGAAHSL